MIPVKKLAKKSFQFITPEKSVDFATNILKKEELDCLLIPIKDTLYGIITRMELWAQHPNRILEDIPILSVKPAGEESPVDEVLIVMEEENVTILPVINKRRKITGIIKRIDIVSFLTEIYRDNFTRLKKELEESETIFRSLLNNMDEGVIYIDARDKIIFCNNVSMQHLNLSMKEVLGNNLLECHPPEHRRKVRRIVRDLKAGKSSSHVKKMPGEMYLESRYFPIIDEKSSYQGTLLITRDITQHRKLEEIKDNLIRDVSHELKHPLAILHMCIGELEELVREEKIDKENVRSLIGMLPEEISRLKKTVDNILDLSRLESGKELLKRRLFALEKTVKKVISDIKPLAETKGITLDQRLPDRTIKVKGDRNRIQTVVYNLLDNAIKFTKKGKVTITVKEEKDSVIVEVKDTGSGLSESEKARIFQRFFQGKARIPGVGIGLAICKNIVEAHGGKIWAESEGRGKGSVFRFSLPAAL